MFLICSWCAPDMILVRSDILAALQGPVRRSGNFHATTQLYALDSIPFLNLIVALTSNGTRLGERKTPWPSQLLLTAVAASLLLPPQAKFGIPVLPLVAATIKIEHTTALPRSGLNNRIKYSHCWDAI